MPSPTLAEIKAKGGSVSFQCRRCRHIARQNLDALAERFGWGMTLERLEGLGRCTAAQNYISGPCGGRSMLHLNLPVDCGDGLSRGS